MSDYIILSLCAIDVRIGQPDTKWSTSSAFSSYNLHIGSVHFLIIIILSLDRLIGLVGRVFVNSPGDLGSIPVLEIVLDTSLLNTQQYKVRIKGKVEQSKEKNFAPPLHLSVVAIEKRAFWSPSTTVANFTLSSYSL